MVSILSGKRGAILQAVRAMYTEVASHPERPFHFPVGRSACELVGYPPSVLAGLPESAVESFAGVGYPFATGGIHAGETVLDIGSGSGTDAFIAARLVGPGGRVIAMDLTDAMLGKLAGTGLESGIRNVYLLKATADEIPLPDASVDVVTSNGVLNLILEKERALSEIHRVLKAGGGLQLADVALGKPIGDGCRDDPQMWAECVVGAVLETDYVEMLRNAGFHEPRVLGRLDYFSASGSPETREIARSFGALSLVLHADKPPAAPRWRPSAWPPPRSVSRTPPDAGATPLPVPDRVVEAYGCGCGEIEPLLRDRMRDMESGQILEIRGDQPELRAGIPAWGRISGNQLVAMSEEPGGRLRFLLRRK